jgi:hypothetical protein
LTLTHVGDDAGVIDPHEPVVLEERPDGLEFALHIFQLPGARDAIVLGQRIGGFSEPDPLKPGERRRPYRHAALSVFQEPLGFLLLFRVRTFPNRLAAAIVFDPEHLASFVDHSHDRPPSFVVVVRSCVNFCSVVTIAQYQDSGERSVTQMCV